MQNKKLGSGKRTGKSKSYKTDGRKKNIENKDRHTDYEKRILDRKNAAENKKAYKAYENKQRNTSFSKPRISDITDNKTRINRYLASGGTCSRREAEKYIIAGAVSVNGKVMTNLSFRVSSSDVVKFNGQIIRGEKKKYILLNKPKDFITTTSDDRGRKTVMQLVKNSCLERIYPVGRLDRKTTGLLLFTNDGDLAKKLVHPKHRVRKIYHVTLDKKLSKHHLISIKNGIDLEDGPVSVDKVSFVERHPNNHVGIELHIGRNRIVRRIFERLGYQVIDLDRVVFGNLTKKDIKRGSWRHLNKKEIELLNML